MTNAIENINDELKIIGAEKRETTKTVDFVRYGYFCMNSDGEAVTSLIDGLHKHWMHFKTDDDFWANRTWVNPFDKMILQYVEGDISFTIYKDMTQFKLGMIKMLDWQLRSTEWIKPTLPSVKDIAHSHFVYRNGMDYEARWVNTRDGIEVIWFDTSDKDYNQQHICRLRPNAKGNARAKCEYRSHIVNMYVWGDEPHPEDVKALGVDQGGCACFLDIITENIISNSLS